jgi:hypothetical protein
LADADADACENVASKPPVECNLDFTILAIPNESK